MSRIFKYELSIQSRQVIMMPKGAAILDIGRQGPLAYLWATVDPDQPLEARVFRMVTTGEVYNEERLWYIGHVQLGGEPTGNGLYSSWFEAWYFEVEQALPQLTPDPIEGRFAEDVRDVNSEVDRAVEARIGLVRS